MPLVVHVRQVSWQQQNWLALLIQKYYKHSNIAKGVCLNKQWTTIQHLHEALIETKCTTLLK